MGPLSEAEWQALALSLQVSAAAVGIGLPLALAIAWLLVRVRPPGAFLIDAVVHLPLVVPPVVVGLLLLIGFGPNGPIGRWLLDLFGWRIAFTWQAAALAAGIMAFPLMVRAIRLSLEALDRRLEETARTLGLGAFATFRRVTLPLLLPGLLSGAILGFARCLGEFGATITFTASIPGATQTLPLAIFAALETPDGEGAALRLAGIALVLAILALAASEWLARRARRRLGG